MIKVQKRNGQIIEFIPTRIIQAIASAFKEHSGIPRETELGTALAADVQKVTGCVVSVLNERSSQRPFLTVEEIQDEVIRQLYENGFKEVAGRYASYRRYQAGRRKLFELYSIIKRDGKVVSFKQEKITLAIAKALIAQNKSVYNEILIEKAQELSDKVIDEIILRWPDGKSIPIEEVQDIVEKVIMACGYLEVAKRYILYRADRAKVRCNRSGGYSESSLEGLKDLTIVNEEGKQNFLDLDELRLKFEICCHGLTDVSPREVLREALKHYFNGMSVLDLLQADVMAAHSLIVVEPQYSFVAARLLLLAEYQEATGQTTTFGSMRREYPQCFFEYIHKASDHGLIDPALKEFDLKLLGLAIVPERDFTFHHAGLQILYDHYLIQLKGRHIELPQIFWMRVAMGLALHEGELKNEKAVEFYHILSTFRFLPSSTALFNSGCGRGPVSCSFVSSVEDDLTSIFKSIQDSAFVFKAGGMVGNDWTNIAHGVIPYLKMVNDACLAVHQAAKPRGSLCAYLEIWHWEIEEFLQLHKSTGDERRRARDIHTAVWIPDLFMKRVKNNGNWTLFAPSEVADLHDKYGKDFERCFEEYEQRALRGAIKDFKTIPAVQLWRKILTAALETGHPWIAWKDPSNVRFTQDHIGVVHSADASMGVLLNTFKDEGAVCHLGAVNLANHIGQKGLDHQKLKETITTAIRMLDNMIESGDKHRAVGLGIMGFQEALYALGLGLACREAVNFADESMEAVSYFVLLADAHLAGQRGSYASYKDSQWSRGLLPSDTIEMLENQRGGYLSMDSRRTMDWVPVRAAIKQYGLRNSMILSVSLNQDSADIAGVSASIEPRYKNLCNEFLINDLKKLGLWDKEMLHELKYFDGSIQEINRIPDVLKAKYPTAFEIDQEWIIEAASRRQKWIDMGQSVNLYFLKPSIQKISDMVMLAWEKGLKATCRLRWKGQNRIERSVLEKGII